MNGPSKTDFNPAIEFSPSESDLFKISKHNQDWLLKGKIKSMENQICFSEYDMCPEIYKTVCEFILKSYPGNFKKPHTFENLVLQMQEDLMIYRCDDQYNWLASAFVCFPYRWRVEEEVGLSFDRVYDPINKTKCSIDAIKKAINGEPIERTTWVLAFDDQQLNYHPKIKSKVFNKANPVIHCRVQKQIIVGFPKHNAFLLINRQWIVSEKSLNLKNIHDAINKMTTNEEKYNNIYLEAFQIKNYLKDKISNKTPKLNFNNLPIVK